MPESFEIGGEEDLLRALEMMESGDWPADQIPLFVDWPLYEIAIEGEDFDGGIPTRVMPALIELQRTMNRAYARSVHGSPRRLNSREARQTQLIIRLEPGSTKFVVALAKLLNVAFENMSGRQRARTIVAVAAILTLGDVRTAEMDAETERLEIEYQVEMDAQETRRLEIVADLVSKNIELTELMTDMTRIQGEWLKRLDTTDRLFINGEEIETGDDGPGRTILRTKSEHIVSVFRILSVISGGVGPGFRMRVLNIETGERFRVTVSENTLHPRELATLQQSEWGKAALQMEIVADRRDGKIRRARLLSVKPVPPSQS